MKDNFMKSVTFCGGWEKGQFCSMSLKIQYLHLLTEYMKCGVCDGVIYRMQSDPQRIVPNLINTAYCMLKIWSRNCT